MNKILYHPKPGTTGFFYGDFPEERQICFTFSNSYPCDGLNEHSDKEGYCKCFEYKEAFELAKEEAIKNGEIVNPEILPNIKQFIEGKWYYIGKFSCLLEDDIFDLPEGITVQKENRHFSHGQWHFHTEKEIEDYENFECKTVYWLVPIKEEKKPVKEETGRAKSYCQREIENHIACSVQCDHCRLYYKPLEIMEEENQEELWKEIFKQAKYSTSDEMPFQVKAWIERFTIQRKTK